MKASRPLAAIVFLLVAPCLLLGAENLKLNPHLDYSDHNRKQGPLITGDHMDSGVVKGMPNYLIFYMEKCYNAKRQARITVHMYNKYRDIVHFVIVDVDQPMTEEMRMLRLKYCFKVIPHTTILDRDGNVVFDYTGETDEATMDGWLDYAIRTSQTEEEQHLVKTGGEKAVAEKSGGEK